MSAIFAYQLVVDVAKLVVLYFILRRLVRVKTSVVDLANSLEECDCDESEGDALEPTLGLPRLHIDDASVPDIESTLTSGRAS